MNKLVWVDVETTGLDPSNDRLLEVGLVITDEYGRHRDHYSECLRLTKNMDPLDDFITKMHTKSGLLTDCQNSHGTPAGIQTRILTFLTQHFGTDKIGPMCGSSVHFDRNFLREWMPQLHDRFHYRNIDISSFGEVMSMVNPLLANKAPEKREIHRSLPDLEDTIEYYKFLLDNFVYVDDSEAL